MFTWLARRQRCKRQKALEHKCTSSQGRVKAATAETTTMRRPERQSRTCGRTRVRWASGDARRVSVGDGHFGTFLQRRSMLDNVRCDCAWMALIFAANSLDGRTDGRFARQRREPGCRMGQYMRSIGSELVLGWKWRPNIFCVDILTVLGQGPNKNDQSDTFRTKYHSEDRLIH